MRRSDLVVGRTYTGDEAREAVVAASPWARWTYGPPTGPFVSVIPSLAGPDPIDGEEWILRCLDVRESRPPTLPPEPPEGFVRVRVAVAVDRDGDWFAYGSDDRTDDEASEIAAGETIVDGRCPDGVRVTFVTADVPLPTVAAVVGVCDAEE